MKKYSFTVRRRGHKYMEKNRITIEAETYKEARKEIDEDCEFEYYDLAYVEFEDGTKSDYRPFLPSLYDNKNTANYDPRGQS